MVGVLCEMQRFIIFILVIANIITFIVLYHVINISLKQSVLINQFEKRLIQMDEKIINLTDPQTIENRTIDYIFRRNEFQNRP